MKAPSFYSDGAFSELFCYTMIIFIREITFNQGFCYFYRGLDFFLTSPMYFPDRNQVCKFRFRKGHLLSTQSRSSQNQINH